MEMFEEDIVDRLSRREMVAISPEPSMVIMTEETIYAAVLALILALTLLLFAALTVGILRAGVKNILPFIAVAGSGAVLGARQ